MYRRFNKLEIEVAISCCAKFESGRVYCPIPWYKGGVVKFQTSLKIILPNDDLRCIFSICSAEDNQGCIADARNRSLSDLSKHVDVKYQFVGDHIRNGNINIHYVSTIRMVVDSFTKNLPTKQFH